MNELVDRCTNFAHKNICLIFLPMYFDCELVTWYITVQNLSKYIAESDAHQQW